MRIINSAYLDIHGNLYQNGKQINHLPETSMEEAYKQMRVDYPKFYKMDRLSQLGFILAELVLKHTDEEKPSGLLIWNKYSSHDADMKHQENVRLGASGPANFTYTLPNIVVGEIAIRHQIKGETGVFLSPEFSIKELGITLNIYTEGANGT